MTQPLRPRFLGLADCNNFFVSCELLLKPELCGQPAVVLSGPDGCIVARSNEAKDLNIPMAAPYFKFADYLKHKNVAIFTGNMPLYKKISRRVMNRISDFTDILEQYSIDESFFNLAIASIPDPVRYCLKLRQTILDEIGIPVSIGIAETKTLCKLASEKAKKASRRDSAAPGVFLLLPGEVPGLLASTTLSDIWGLGKKSVERLSRHGIRTALDFARADEDFLQQLLSIRGVMTARELRGIQSFPLTGEKAKQQSLQLFRSYSNRLTEENEIRQRIISFASEASFKLRQQKLKTRSLQVVLKTSRFDKQPFRTEYEVLLHPPTSVDTELIDAAIRALAGAFVPGKRYAQIGILLPELIDCEQRQLDLFSDNVEEPDKGDRLMSAIDLLNEKLGKNTITPAAVKIAIEEKNRMSR